MTYSNNAVRVYSRLADNNTPNQPRLFIVRPEHAAILRQADAANRMGHPSGIVALAGAALAAPVLWLTHSALQLFRIR